MPCASPSPSELGLGRGLGLDDWLEALGALCDAGALARAPDGAAAAYRSTAPPLAAGGDAARCVVCMEDIAVGDVLRRMAKCPHAGHAPCLERWLATNPKCPVCGTV